MRKATLQALLDEPGLDLRLVGAEEVAADELERQVAGVHSSDLPDPTPFLDEGMVLLITGSQLEVGPQDAGGSCSGYVARLREHGVLGLGFGSGVVHPAVPEALVRACRQHGMPLFDVPYGTPSSLWPVPMPTPWPTRPMPGARGRWPRTARCLRLRCGPTVWTPPSASSRRSSVPGWGSSGSPVA